MRVSMGIDVGHTTGLAVVAYFESPKKPVVYHAFSYPVNELKRLERDLWDCINRYKPDEVLVEYPEVTRHNTYKPELLKNIISLVRDMLTKVPCVREVRPTDWKQTPALDKEFRYGQSLNTRHEADAAKMCFWASVYAKRSV